MEFTPTEKAFILECIKGKSEKGFLDTLEEKIVFNRKSYAERLDDQEKNFLRAFLKNHLDFWIKISDPGAFNSTLEAIVDKL